MMHAAAHAVSRSELAFLRALFIRLCQIGSDSKSGSATATPRSSSSTTSSSSSSTGVAPPLTQMELLALRLPRALVVRLLLSPSFPWLRSVQLNRVAATLGFQGHSGGALDWSEFVVLAFALWHGGEELPRLARSLVDAAQNGKVARKDWRRAAAPLFADQAAWAAAESAAASAAPAIVVQQQASGGSSAAPSTLPAASSAATGAEWLLWSAAARSGPAVAQPDSNGVLRGLEREWLSNLFDVHWHLACYFYDRDYDGSLSVLEFGRFCDEDPLLQSLLHMRRLDARAARQHIFADLNLTYAQVMDTPGALPVAPAANTQGAATTSTRPATAAAASPSHTAAASSSSSNSSRPGSTRRPSALIAAASSEGLCRTFLGDGAVEESSGQIWRRQRRTAAAAASNGVQRQPLRPATAAVR